MTESYVLTLAQNALQLVLMLAGPALLVSLVVGSAISLLQAATSVNEATLTFVPKIGAMMAVYWVSMSFMSGVLVTFFTDTIVPLISGI